MHYRIPLRIVIALFVVCGIATFFALGLERSFTLNSLRENGDRLIAMKR
jgi:hypothetical protein